MPRLTSTAPRKLKTLFWSPIFFQHLQTNQRNQTNQDIVKLSLRACPSFFLSRPLLRACASPEESRAERLSSSGGMAHGKRACCVARWMGFYSVNTNDSAQTIDRTNAMIIHRISSSLMNRTCDFWGELERFMSLSKMLFESLLHVLTAFALRFSEGVGCTEKYNLLPPT